MGVEKPYWNSRQANKRYLYSGDSDGERVVYKRKRFHYQHEESHEFSEEEECGEGEEVPEVREEEEFDAEDEYGEEEMGESEESYWLEHDEEINAASSSSKKRIKETPIDRLSALPDSLLIRILSNLRMQEAAMTCVLSKRWQFLWTDLPRLEFRESSHRTEKTREFVAWVHRTLVISSGNHLEKLEVNFMYNKSFVSDVNVWVEFALKNKVKDVFLRLINSLEDLYMLPQMMYCNSSLTRLTLQGCIMAPRTTIDWKSLTKLDLSCVELRQHVVENILSSCPVLISLSLMEFWGFNCLEVHSQSLGELIIRYWKDWNSESLLEISAPNLHYLEVSLYAIGRKLRLTNISSLVDAYINFDDFDGDASRPVNMMSYMKELLENLQHVKKLELGLGCFHGYPTCSPKGDLNCDLLHLKTVDIRCFADDRLDGEPMLTLVQLLLKRARVLRKMVIVDENESIGSDVYFKIAQTLLSYPRSSRNAVVLVS
ncbi:hypothetical protein DH2020_010801 [Rehmannia glutinosa]|uniref:F-box domain-containing protein n=1 Tax=Rehmannia glutinosa TaxID=99300 RepID=A0ABR0XBL7_REHGL